jgi:predicted RNA-binding protein with EMAP domain
LFSGDNVRSIIEFESMEQRFRESFRKSALRFEELLNSDQLKKLEDQMEEIKERIRTEIFEHA